MKTFCKHLSGLLFCAALPLAAAETDGIVTPNKYINLDYWRGNTGGNAPMSPAISIIDSPCGKAVQAQAVSDGRYQGANLFLPELVDTEGIGTVEFDFCQTAYHNDGIAQLILVYDNNNGMMLRFPYKQKGWSHVVIPIDLRTINMLSPGTPVHGKVKEARFSIFDGMDTTNETIAVANLRFVPKQSGSQKIAVSSYRYLSARPGSGEKTNLTLTDGIVSKDSQVHYNWYTEDPYIEFDLGALYLVDNIVLQGIAVPSQNIASITIESSTDGKNFRAVANFVNKDVSAEEKLFSIDSGKVSLLGRYFRIKGYRSRTDFPIDISEVSFSGKLPSDEELRQAAAASYNLGPEMPEINDENYYFYQNNGNSFAICKKTGILRNLSCDGTIVVDRMLSSYDLSDGKNQLLANDYTARIGSFRKLDNGVEFTFTVDKLDNIVFKRFYGWKDGVFSTRLSFESKRNDRQILQTTCEVIMPQAIRTGGRYETWGAGHSMEYKQADELTMEMPADTGPVISFESPDKGLTFLNFRYRYNDRYVQIGSGTVTVVGYGDKRTKFTDNGWILGDGLFEINSSKTTGSIESCLITVKGDLVDAFDLYLEMPETKAFRSAIERPAWLEDVRMSGSGDAWKNLFGKNSIENARFYDQLIREGYILNVQLNNTFTWGDWDKSFEQNRVINEFGGEMSADQHRAFIAAIHEASPKTKVTEYTWMWSASAHSQVFSEHPEWFIVKNAAGATVSFFPGALNHYRLYGRPGSPSFEHAVKTITNTINQNNYDFWYLDGGGSPSAVDWARLVIEEPDTYDAFYQTVRKNIRSQGDRGIYFNHPENPLGDIGLLEGSPSAFFSDANWRDGAAWMYKFKLWQRSDPRKIPCFTYWGGPAVANLKYYVIGTGLLPMAPADNALNFVKYVSIYQQTRWAKLVSADFAPNWRNDTACKWELMPLTFGKQGHLMVRSHHTEAAEDEFSCELAPLGVDNRNLPVYCYIYTAVPAKGAIPESEAEEAYRKTNWQSDFLLKGEFIGTRPWSERLTQSMTVPANSLKLIYVTQSPALVWSVDDLRIQYPMSEALDVKVSGALEDGALVLNATSKRRSAEIIANIPAGMTAKLVTINGQEIESAGMTIMNSNFVKFAIPTGDSNIVVELDKALAAPQGNYTLSVNAAQADSKLHFELTTPEIMDTINGSLVILNSAGVPVWADTLAMFGDKCQVSVKLPEVLTGDTYCATAYDPAGRELASSTFKLANIPAKLKPWIHRMSPVAGGVRDIPSVTSAAGTVISKLASQYSTGDSAIEFDPTNASVTLLMAKRPHEIWSLSAGAMLNSNLKRYIKVRIEGNYEEYAIRTGVGVRNVTPCYGDSPSAAVMTIDYQTGNGFTVRSFAGLGIVFAERATTYPDNYGSKGIPEHISVVSGFCLGGSGASEELWLDLQQLGAPADWNGTAYLGLCLQNSTPARKLKLTLLETADTLPAGVQTGKAAVLKGSVQQQAQELRIPRISGTIKLDGVLDEKIWEQALTLTDFNMLNAPTVASPPGKLQMLTDGKMLYIGVEFHEPGEIYADTNAGNAWQTDGIELYFARGEKNDIFDQYIFSAAGTYYAARYVGKQPPKMHDEPQWKVRLEEHTIWFEAAIPLKYNENDPDFNGFNSGRNRTGKQQGFFSLAPGNNYRNFSSFKLILE